MTTFFPVQLIKDRFQYNPETGDVVDKRRNKELERTRGYKAFRLKSDSGKFVYVSSHRIAWVLFYSKWPDNHIDHINGITGDNRICNLRDVTHSQNCANRRMNKNNKTGCKGVCFCVTENLFLSRIGFQGKRIHLGWFKTFEEARDAYEKASVVYQGEFRNK